MQPKATCFGKLALFFETLLIFLNIQFASSYSLNGYVLTDLTANDAAGFAADAASWTLSAYVRSGVKTYVCNNRYLMGGYNILDNSIGAYYERIYTGLPAHNLITFSFDFQPIDSWDGYVGGLNGGNDRFEMSFDGAQYEMWRLSIFDRYATQICGGDWADFPLMQVYLTIPHSGSSGSSLRFRVLNYLDQDSADESFGFRNIKMVFSTVASPAYTVCGICNDSPLPEKICKCDDPNMYMDPPDSGHCFYCNSKCKTCNGGTANDCVTCPDGQYVSSGACYDCTYNCKTCNGGTEASCLTCQPAYPYIVNSNRCVQTCYSPLYTAAEGSNTACKSPCSATNNWALWDGQCSDVCSEIFLTQQTYNTFKVCEYPCPAGSPFMYYDGVCDSSCPSPLTTRDFHGKNYCDHTCTTTSDFLYWDKGCESFCTYPLSYITTHGRKVCKYPCADNQYLYWDGTCGNSCFFPQIIRLFHGKNFCDFPCSGGQFLYWNNTCRTGCPYPLITRQQRGQNYCDYPCSGSEFLFWNGSCLVNCNSPPLTARIEGSARFCDYPCTSDKTLHWNGTCDTVCNLPRSYREEGTPVKKFCYFPCNTNEFLYWNTSCKSACNAPLKTVYQESRYFCQYPCQSNEFLYWNGSCKTSCSAPLNTRVEAGLNYCDFPCTGSDYLYWNGSCISSCVSPLVQRTTDGNLFCDYPCDVSQYLYWEGTCGISCNFPLTYRSEKGRNYCDYSCTGSDFLYWNGSCVGTCTLFTQRLDKGKNFCDFQCNSNDYIYWDRSCSGSCAYPLNSHTEGNPMIRKFCDYPCAIPEFLYWNSTCATSCDFPLSQRVQNSRNFCSQPCDVSEFLYWNGSCKTSCPSPLVTREEAGRKYCDYPCQDVEYLYWNGSCKAACDSPLSTRLVDGNYFCDFPCDPSLYLFWDGSCSGSCSSPRLAVSEGTPVRYFCKFGCNTGEYLYWDGACKSSCAYPLTSYSANSRSFCTYPCPIAKYLYWDQTCGDSCPLPRSFRYENSRNFCDYPCTNGEIVYWNSTCSASCNSPLTKPVSNGKYFCTYPCSDSQYLYWDSSCQTSCDLPLVFREEAGKKYCEFPCSTTQFLYWNGTCSDTCKDPPLDQRTTNSRKFCDYPCSLSEYLYWNGSCKTGCLFPLSTRLEADRNYCDYPCTSSEYLYWNGSCLPTCPTPLNIRIDAGDKYCDFKCAADQILTWDGLCTTECLSPRTLVTEGTPERSYCRYDCNANQFLYWNGTCASTCAFPLVNKVINSRLFCQIPCTSTQFLSWNGTCLDSCPLPYKMRMQAGDRYCDYPCTSSQYLYWDGTCSSTCNAPLVQRTNLTNKFCDYKCADNEYLYWDGTCQSSCVPPLKQVLTGERFLCTYTCSSSSDFLYWDGTCSSTCASPLVQYIKNGKKICTFACDQSKYLYWDGTCLSYCEAPLVSTTVNGRKICKYQCSSSQYLSWDGTCINSCDSPYNIRADKGVFYCDYPCDSSQFMLWNGTCASECPTPLVSRNKVSGSVTRQFCDFACGANQFWSNWSNSCVATCNSPYILSISTEGSYCNLPCANSSHFYFAELGTCKESCDEPFTINKGSPYLQCETSVTNGSNLTETTSLSGMLFNALFLAPVGDGTLTLVKVVKVMQYLRFLDIKLPPRLERLGSSKGRVIMTFQSDSRMLSEKADALAQSSLPSVFARQQLSYTFVVNFWGTFLFIISTLVAALVFTILQKIAHKYQWQVTEAVFKTLRIITRWNLVIMLIATSIDDIILYTSIEFRSTNVNAATSANYFSLFLCVVFIILTIAMIVGMTWLLRKSQKLKRTVASDNFALVNFEDKYKDFQVVFRGFKDNNAWNPYFFLIYTLRIGVPMFFTVVASSVPVFITVIQLIVSVLIVGYLIVKKPFKKQVNHFQLLIYELIVLIMNFCMFVLTILSVSGTDGGDFFVVLGDIVIFGNDVINAWPFIFFVIRLWLEAKTMRKYFRSQKTVTRLQKVRYLQLISLVFQQVNMGFEELIEDLPGEGKLSARGYIKNMAKQIDGDTKPISSTRYNRVRTVTPVASEEKSYLFNDVRGKEDNSVSNILAGYKDPVGESLFIPKTEEIDISSPEIGLKNTKNAFDNRFSSDYSPSSNKKKETLSFNLDATQISNVSPQYSPIQSPQKIEKDIAIKEVEEEKPEPLRLPSVYQPVLPQTNTRKPENKKAKKFLTYNWEDVNAPAKVEDEKKKLEESSISSSLAMSNMESPSKKEQPGPSLFKVDASEFEVIENIEETPSPQQKPKMDRIDQYGIRKRNKSNKQK